MEDTRDLLVEIGTEELPPTALLRLSNAFEEGLRSRLEQNQIAFGATEAFATPRRLALLVKAVADKQPDQAITRRGPAVTAAFDSEGRPTQAALGFARSCGVNVGDLRQEKTAKGAWLVFREDRPGRCAADLLPELVLQALSALPIPKRMRWGAGEDEFVRPVHWAVLLYGSEIIKGRLLGVETGGKTLGHRFHSPSYISIGEPSDYAELLRSKGVVEPSFAVRREMIKEQVESLARQIGGIPMLDAGLLDEVTALCEWPTAILGSFDEVFLEVPPEVLVETMKKHQKYFPVISEDGRLLPRFITISNIRSRNPDQVRAGNERVIRPRFKDAAFFWQQDLKQPLESFGSRLNEVVFQEKLGTLADKSARVSQICRHVAGLLGFDEELAARSARLAKCDLVTQMIFEFPSLQGLMGTYYAQRSGEDPCVVAAMEEQYLPRQAGDRLPESDCGRILSIADKLDTLVGIFAIGQRPTGVKDPYALRRASIGLLRILIEARLPLDLKELLEFTAEELRDKVDAGSAAEDVYAYVIERLYGYYQEQGIGADTIESAIASGTTIPSDLNLRVVAVDRFRRTPEAEALTAANKRIRNILRKNDESIPALPDAQAMTADAERALLRQVIELKREIGPLLDAQNYRDVLVTLAQLRHPVDTFFEQVMVMDADPLVRKNRLALLNAVESLFLRVADISRLQ